MALFFLTLFVLGPAFVARLVQRARWKTIGIAFALWFGGLVLMGLLSGNPAEGLAWAVIPGMFLSLVMVPVIVWIIHHSGCARTRPHRIVQSRSFGKGWRPRPRPIP